MQTERLAHWRQLEESVLNLDRADLEAQRQSECWGSYRSPIDDFQNLEIWRRVLAAHTQPLADAAD